MIVVTGATGNIGRPLVRALAAAGEDVTAVARRVTAAEVPPGVRAVPADLAEPTTLKAALDGADALFLLLAGDLLGPGDDPAEVLAAAGAGGVGRIVLLSSQGAGTRADVPSHSRLAAFEEAVRAAGPDWTILRPGGFHTNAYQWAESIRTARTAAAPFAGVGLPFVDPADIAEVAAAVLREDGHTGRVYELTGPAPVSPRERARAIGEALGAPVRFTEQTPAEAREEMLRFMPAPVADGTLAILGRPLPAERRVSPDVERVLGRPPRSFADWAARNAPAFA
ncbi:NAD(P)H-binding protein [Streptomyces litchfieldiae]|uniref:NAD(P)H-binding protein n=1 Tax=Streptomyces litchfieldiae TaxID=3075543 RepID=A0ABU2MJR1_9ACTN|nr:NAD(P)H-binding protein [Streptomyces sp. DSM 44938]MDT0341840.1 NAD(P)H-binding protein [Streptomyces sp. DSM 44938]